MLIMIDTMIDLNLLEDAHSSGAYLKRDIQIVRGEGAWLWDDAGNRYIDCVGGQGAANLGHGHPAVLAAIQQQAAKLISCPELFHNPVRARYQAALCEAAGMPRVFLCNSGAEANEGALKIARLKTGRTGIIAAMRGFHGRTMGALSATWEKAYREPFLPLMSDVTHVPYNNIDRLRDALDDNTAAVVLEVVQGEGGVHPAAEGYLRAVQELCHANGSLLILDEVQTGFGRTGYLFAHQYEGVQPDIMTLAKSIAGRYSDGRNPDGRTGWRITPSFTRHNLWRKPIGVCSRIGGTGCIADYRPDRTQREQLGNEVREHLAARLPEKAVREVRGRGFMFGIELRGKVAPILRELQSRGLLALPAGASVLRLLPPLIISDDALWQATAIIEEVLDNAF